MSGASHGFQSHQAINHGGHRVTRHREDAAERDASSCSMRETSEDLEFAQNSKGISPAPCRGALAPEGGPHLDDPSCPGLPY